MSPASRSSAGSIAAAVLLAVLVVLAWLPGSIARADNVPTHLVVSEVVTGGTSASDELIELYNPTDVALPLEGLELVYVSASGATVSRRAAWELGAPHLGAGRHLLVANELGVYAAIADAIYASGMAATGGSVALRIQGASTAIDAVGWGTAASSWLEGTPAPALTAGSSLERLPGGALGSTVDTDDNQADFTVRATPEPQNLGSAPVPEPGATPSPGPSGSPAPTAAPTSTPTPAPTVVPSATDDLVPIATARALPDDSVVTIEGTALSHSAFTDGGGFVADGSGGIAVLVTGGAFARGDRLRLTGTVDDRFSQRTLRVAAADLVVLGTGSEPGATVVTTGGIDEGEEGRLVRVSGALVGSASELSGGVAFDLDDGSGPTRLVVASGTGIDLAAWEPGTALQLIGVVGQRDSTGSGVTGYRVHPRDPADVLAVEATTPSPTPQPTASAGPDPSPGDEPPAGVVSIAAARALPKNAQARVRGTVTMAPGIVDPTTAVIQDASGAIVLRIGEDVGPLARGEVVTVDGVRSTKSGMETLRVSIEPIRSGNAPEPPPRQLKTGSAGEADEARLVIVRGAVVASARRSSSGTVSFEIDDGSGPLRISVAAAVALEQASLSSGTWVEVTGVLGQDTTGAQPLRGYRAWPRDASDLRTLAGPTGAAGGAEPSGADTGGAAVPTVGLDAIGGPDGEFRRIGATLVSAAWPEIGVGGLLWDGTRIVALEAAAAEAIQRAIGPGRPPVSIELSGLRAAGTLDDPGLPVFRIGEEPDALLAGTTPPAAPATSLPDDGDAPRWVAVVGRLAGHRGTRTLTLHGGRAVALDIRCERGSDPSATVVGVIGIATADPARVVVPCDGVRAAPGLGRSNVDTALGLSGPSSARLAALPGGSAKKNRAPIGPAALLGLAAVGLVGGALAARRMKHDDPEGTDPAASDVDEAADEPMEVPTPPVLTLVPLPRDRAP
ncbi:MAG: hypothetical protein M3Y40_06950 [Chloroflexota bacterium]|nr:hypothetical protein [Chloroflexota bacterium]